MTAQGCSGSGANDEHGVHYLLRTGRRAGILGIVVLDGELAVP